VKTEYRFSIEPGSAAITAPVTITFSASGVIGVAENDALVPRAVDSLRLELRIDPPERTGKPDPNHGHLVLVVPGDPAEMGPFAEHLASDIGEYLAFYHEGFRVLRGAVFAKRIPENAEERSIVGDHPYAVSLKLSEVGEFGPLKREKLQLFPKSFPLQRIIRQHNVARAAASGVDRFLGMYKVIEWFYHRDEKVGAKEALKHNQEFVELLRSAYSVRSDDKAAWEVPSDQSVFELVDELVDTRHKCAHLRESSAFGFAPHDRDVYEKVEPLYEIIIAVAQQAIHGRLTSDPALTA
jgi:hypothetical protein